MSSTTSVKLTSEAAIMAKNTNAYILVSVDEAGRLQLSSHGTLMQLCFISAATQDFIAKVLNGQAQVERG